ncbi:rhomboid family intramembrane serine protease GlpG [Alteromonas lipolytica]|uniref:Rhomboid family intramembrane serine protease GlpG n=1 Tax=Alteromonas lipolytica TaxID=1856405 RepID=A0A1E8FHK2_9ALTE|nr:rhomboid family intramembrane serine protease GlpG [Alteromonas lipolytica]OFI35415.1 rhomboid family intramembrane serine protease GlpG [Alteromonas lipolytica]GGF76098.1 rhomboid family intramembrane serine protease GlpG [Alteromonas lipolytica]
MATPLIAISQLRYADALASYLKSQLIPVQVQAEPDKDQYILLLENDEDYARALEICQAFIKAPNDPVYQQAAWQHSDQTDVPAPPSSGNSIRRWLVSLRRAPFTGIILILCTLIFAASAVGLFRPIAEALMIMPLGNLAKNNEWWRLIGPAFIHFSALHFIFNVLWWGMLGSQIEHKFGSSFLLILFLVTALFSNLAQLAVSGPNFGGLSGVVYGVVGFVWIIGWLRPQWGLSMPRAIVGFMLVWLVLGYADILWVNMANAAHTMGLLSGCITAWLLAIGSGKTAPK